MFVPFLELKREAARDRDDIEHAVKRVMERGWYILGPELEALENEFAAYLQAPFAAGVGSGTDALTLALEASGALQPGKGQEVITTALSAAFTAMAICRAGAVPRFVDVHPETLQLDPRRIASCLSERTRAIIPVHLYGQPCQIQDVIEVARIHNLAVVEDACQAHGSRMKGKCLGTITRTAAFSFYPTKNLGALGDAGMVVAQDKELISIIKMLRHGGQSRTYHHVLQGMNSRLDEIQAAVLRCKLKKLDARNEARRRIADRYDEALSSLDLVRLPVARGEVPNRHLYPVRTSKREELRRFLIEQGVETLIHYPVPLPGQPALESFVLPGQEFPVAEKACREILSLPLYPELTEEESEHVIRSVRRFFLG